MEPITKNHIDNALREISDEEEKEALRSPTEEKTEDLVLSLLSINQNLQNQLDLAEITIRKLEGKIKNLSFSPKKIKEPTSDEQIKILIAENEGLKAKILLLQEKIDYPESDRSDSSPTKEEFALEEEEMLHGDDFDDFEEIEFS